jgi:hypothetical protein
LGPNFLVELIIAGKNFLKNLDVFAPGEGRFPRKKEVGDYSKRPQITPDVILFLNHLRR